MGSWKQSVEDVSRGRAESAVSGAPEKGEFWKVSIVLGHKDVTRILIKELL